MPVPQLVDPLTHATFTPDELQSLPDIDGMGSLEVLQKAVVHPRAAAKATTSFDSLLSDLSEVKSMLTHKQNKLLDAAIALSKGLVVESTNSTSKTEISD